MIKPKKRARKPPRHLKILGSKTAFHEDHPWVDVSHLPYLNASECLKLADWLTHAAQFLREREK